MTAVKKASKPRSFSLHRSPLYVCAICTIRPEFRATPSDELSSSKCICVLCIAVPSTSTSIDISIESIEKVATWCIQRLLKSILIVSAMTLLALLRLVFAKNKTLIVSVFEKWCLVYLCGKSVSRKCQEHLSKALLINCFIFLGRRNKATGGKLTQNLLFIRLTRGRWQWHPSKLCSLLSSEATILCKK